MSQQLLIGFPVTLDDLFGVTDESMSYACDNGHKPEHKEQAFCPKCGKPFSEKLSQQVVAHGSWDTMRDAGVVMNWPEPTPPANVNHDDDLWEWWADMPWAGHVGCRIVPGELYLVALDEDCQDCVIGFVLETPVAVDRLCGILQGIGQTVGPGVVDSLTNLRRRMGLAANPISVYAPKEW